MAPDPVSPAVSDEMRRAVIRAVQLRDGDLYDHEADAIIAAVRPLIEAEVRQQIADHIQHDAHAGEFRSARAALTHAALIARGEA